MQDKVPFISFPKNHHSSVQKVNALVVSPNHQPTSSPAAAPLPRMRKVVQVRIFVLFAGRNTPGGGNLKKPFTQPPYPELISYNAPAGT